MNPLLLALLVGALGSARPNIVVFVGDDLGWRDTGPYGNAAIRTPNIDRLARSGLLVRYAFGTSPQCSPSRISILSGRYPHATRTEDLHTPLPSGERLLPSYLQALGYFTVHAEADVLHREGERAALEACLENGASREEVIDAAGQALDAYWRLLDAVCSERRLVSA